MSTNTNMKNQTTIEKPNETQIARPLKQLVPLIMADLKAMHSAEMEAAATISEMTMPFKRAIGEKLLEAKPQLKGRFTEWLKATFPILGVSSANEYMGMAQHEKVTGTRLTGVQHYRRTKRKSYQDNPTGTANWRNEVQQTLNGFNVDQFEHDLRDRREEQQLVAKLAMEVVSIGYKVLATKMHPDKGGSVEAMQRLNNARDLLKGAIE